MVVHETYTTDASYPLKEWDLIAKIGDTKIDDQGMIKMGTNLRVRFQYLIQKIAKDGKIPLTIVRAGKEKVIELPVSPERPMLIPDLKGAYPSYFVFGPLVFSNVTAQFTGGFAGNANALNALSVLDNPIVTRRGDQPAFPGEQLVVVSSPFFPHKLSKGYGPPATHVVKTVNEIAIKNLDHLVEVLRDATGEFVTFEFEGRNMEALVFTRKEMLAATEEILTDNGVRAQGSADTLAVWNAKAPAK
jgi:hypothetical protein